MKRIRIQSPLLVAWLALFAAVRSAHANGPELLPGGTQAVARAGAVAARPENPMTLQQNPAGMALLRGDQILLNVDVAIQDMCVDPYGYYGWGIYQADETKFGNPIALDDPDDPTIGATYATTPLPKVCNTAPVFGLPQLAWVGKLGDNLALGFGFLAPTLITGNEFGDHDGTITVDGKQLPTPTRYQLIDQKVKVAFAPMFGVAYRVLPVLSVGAMVQIASLDVVNRVIQNQIAGTQPSTDMLVDIEAHDYFLPTVTLSVHAKPIDALDVMASFRWADNFNGSGKATYVTNAFSDPEAKEGAIPFRNAPFKLDKITVGLPWTATAGVRYAGLLAAPDASKAQGTALGDPMDRERWDVEVDGSYNWNERSETSAAHAGEEIVLIFRQAGAGGQVQTLAPDDVGQVNLDRHLKDSIAVRAAGSFSIVPRTLAVEGGGFFETRGIDPAYVSVDSFALQRFGFGVGALIRVGDFDLMAAYGHIFQETLEIAPPEHEPAQESQKDDPTRGFDQRVGIVANESATGGVVLQDPDAPAPGKGDAVASLRRSGPSDSPTERVFNAGKYTAAFNIISVGAVYHW